VKFKVGDIVWHENLGMVTEIIGFRRNTGFPYRVKVLTGLKKNFPEEFNTADGYIEYHRVKDTKIARKVYSDKILKIEDNWIYLNE